MYFTQPIFCANGRSVTYIKSKISEESFGYFVRRFSWGSAITANNKCATLILITQVILTRSGLYFLF